MLEIKEQELKVAHEDSLIKKYNKCRHYIIHQHGYNGKAACVLCGLYTTWGVKDFSTEGLIMEKYLYDHRFNSEQNVYYRCDLNLALNIIDKIKKANKNIKRDDLIKYFEIALDNMIDIEVNNKRKKSRAKRLGVKLDNIKRLGREKY